MHAQGISQEHSHLLLAPQPGRYMNPGEAQGSAMPDESHALNQDHFNRLHAADVRVEELEEELAEARADDWPEDLIEELAEKLAYAEEDRDRVAGCGHE